MANFKVQANNKVDIDKKPRVYFTCHPEDFEKYFKKVCDDIFKTHDCAIYYTEDMAELIAENEKEVDLGRFNLFVVPVTFKLLTMPNRAMDEDIPYALKEHIPVLPIMMESGIGELYSKPDKFGELQYLNPFSTDLTEISYEEKLKKYLESVLISDELANRVRAAFDAYIFLSYRKKDRKYANELMRLIHSQPECRDIAVWFDEFLTPGESFKDSIEEILNDCKLFTLLVTPQLLEKVVDKDGEERDNYVISTELPLARKNKAEKGIDIFAVEMEDTDKEALSAISIEDYVNCRDSEFRTRLLDAISRMTITTNNTSEHIFLIGLAYLDGIDMEIDVQKAILLITEAAKSGELLAIEKLANMYKTGDNVERDILVALKWMTEKSDLLYKQYLDDPSIETLQCYFYSLIDAGDTCFEAGLYGSAEECYSKAVDCLYEIETNDLGRTVEAHRFLMLAEYKYADLFAMQKKNKRAKRSYMAAIEESIYVFECNPSEQSACDMALCYAKLAKLEKELLRYSNATEYISVAITAIQKAREVDINQNNTMLYSLILKEYGDLWQYLDLSKAKETYKDAINLCKDNENSKTFTSNEELLLELYLQMVECLFIEGDMQSAADYCLAAYTLFASYADTISEYKKDYYLSLLSLKIAELNLKQEKFSDAKQVVDTVAFDKYDNAGLFWSLKCSFMHLLGDISQKEKDYSSAIEYYNASKTFSEALKNTFMISLNYYKLGCVVKLSNKKLAKRYFLICINKLKKINKKSASISSLELLGDAYLELSILSKFKGWIYRTEATAIFKLLTNEHPQVLRFSNKLKKIES